MAKKGRGIDLQSWRGLSIVGRARSQRPAAPPGGQANKSCWTPEYMRRYTTPASSRPTAQPHPVRPLPATPDLSQSTFGGVGRPQCADHSVGRAEQGWMTRPLHAATRQGTRERWISECTGPGTAESQTPHTTLKLSTFSSIIFFKCAQDNFCEKNYYMLTDRNGFR